LHTNTLKHTNTNTRTHTDTATSALTRNGITWLGVPLRVNHPQECAVAEASKESEKIDQARATLKARRVYVGNLPQITPPLTDEALKQFVDTAMQETGLSEEAECVVEVWISPEKHFSFVELRTVQEATNALSLNGINMFGSTLRFNRPHDYAPETTLAGLEGGGVVVAAGLGQTGVASVAGIAESSSALVDVYSQAAHAAAALKLASLMQATKKARRVHVGNLKEFVDTAMIQLLLVVKVGEPVIDTFLSSDGKFGFVEMRTVAEPMDKILKEQKILVSMRQEALAHPTKCTVFPECPILQYSSVRVRSGGGVAVTRQLLSRGRARALSLSLPPFLSLSLACAAEPLHYTVTHMLSPRARAPSLPPLFRAGAAGPVLPAPQHARAPAPVLSLSPRVPCPFRPSTQRCASSPLPFHEESLHFLHKGIFFYSHNIPDFWKFLTHNVLTKCADFF